MPNEKEWSNGRIELQQHNCHRCKEWVLKLKIGGAVQYLDKEEAGLLEEIFRDARERREVTDESDK